MAASSLPLHVPPLSRGFQTSPKSSSITFQIRRNSNSLYKNPISASLSSSNPSSSSSWEREEIRWLREEQRWLREEKRWIREESRWNSDRESLLREIAALKLRIEALEREKSLPTSSISDAVSNLASILQALKESDVKSAVSWIPESGSGPQPVLLEEGEVKEMVLEEIRVSESVGEVRKEEGKKKATLRKGSEGKDVQEMQEALGKLGFYSGEEDMEYSCFSSGTERAVKTWQASVGTREDGVMTAELLERLFIELGNADAGLKANVDGKDPVSLLEGANGALVGSVTEITEIQQTVVKESGVTEVDLSQHRVFLLGENRWEEPSRLVDRDKPINGSKSSSATKCLTCRGEGRLLCTECDGTGEPNVEPQFLEWVDEGANCPYCEGAGYTICDVCEGKAAIQT
ncbi:protein disulfide isomerase pTAC5, chloroplastic [Magnolia sinica]|uniref:protein disulfide isomerase pTAC5, chloroplastic n=1 Tax=Magnolia sinica TaxID=86752 RepID=UPI00265932A8|nr:protein disulfide isomerase pTAC5, chloroplastic [Magnolia sinica]